MTRLGVFALAASLGGCQSYLFDQKCPASVSEAQVSVAVAQPVPVDILFVIDNSGSMAPDQENLARNIDAFIDVIAGGTLDYRIGIVTTDLGQSTAGLQLDREEWAGFVGQQVDESSPLRTVDFQDRSDCRRLPGVRHGCFRSSRPDRPFLDSGLDDARTVAEVFSASARVGTCGSGLERGTTAMLQALEATRSGGCNAGFLRDEANLVVVIISDEQDNFPLPPDEILRRLDAVKPLENVRFGFIGSVVGGEPSRCRTGADGQPTAECGSLCAMPRPPADDQGPCNRDGSCSAFSTCVQGRCLSLAHVFWDGAGFGCDSCTTFDVPDCCSADLPADSYFGFALALEQAVSARDPSITASRCQGGGDGRPACLVDSICQAEFADTLRRIAEDLVLSTDIDLEPPASYPEGVVVQIRGGRFVDAPRVLEQGTDFMVSADGRRISLRSTSLLPRADEDLDIFFVVESPVSSELRGACAE